MDAPPSNVNSLQRGRSLPLSPGRVLVGDLLHACRNVPLIPIERRMALAPLMSARNRMHPRLSWIALFVKAFAMVAQARPELRRLFLSWPNSRLYEHPESIAAVIIERELDGEKIVLPARMRRPESRSLSELDDWLKQSKARPLSEVQSFRRALRISRWPTPFRRLLWWIATDWSGTLRAEQIGTFGLSVTAGFGAATLSVRSPCTTTLHYGCFEANGILPVRMTFDHRVLDGAVAARALVDLEATLLGPIAAEVKSAAQAAA